jgi:hypothetical protein
MRQFVDLQIPDDDFFFFSFQKLEADSDSSELQVRSSSGQLVALVIFNFHSKQCFLSFF